MIWLILTIHCLNDDILVVTRGQGVLKQDTNIQQQNDAHLDHVVNSIFDVGEQKVNLPQSVTISDNGNPFCVDDSPDLPNLFVETETLNWEEIINLNRGKLQKLQSECHSLKELFKIINKDIKEEIRTHYLIDNGILMRSWKERNSLRSAVNQIVVPKILRNEILRLGQQSALSALLGIHKTFHRISNHFLARYQCCN